MTGAGLLKSTEKARLGRFPPCFASSSPATMVHSAFHDFPAQAVTTGYRRGALGRDRRDTPRAGCACRAPRLRTADGEVRKAVAYAARTELVHVPKLAVARGDDDGRRRPGATQPRTTARCVGTNHFAV